jgi:hypothetical protein
MTYDKQDEWGPWIEHDGRGCPCVGRYVQAEHNQEITDWSGPKNAIINGRFVTSIATNGRSWIWADGFTKIIRYRIRKPRGMAILESLLANLPEECDA